MIILTKELLEKLVTSEYLTMNEREQLIKYIEVMEDFKIFYELYNVLENRIDKAIEYIENKQELNKMFGTITLSKDSQKELLEILQGSAKE